MKDIKEKFILATDQLRVALEKMNFAVTQKLLAYIACRERNLN